MEYKIKHTHHVLDLGLDASDPKQRIMGMQNINDKVYVFTQDRIFELKEKSKLKVWWEKLWRGGR